jgi:uncharacterized protein (TIGR03437 family)
VRPMTHLLRQFIRYRGSFCLAVALGFLARPAYAQLPATWSFAGPLGVPARVVSLAADPRNDSVIYLLAPGGGVWKTQDGGAFWTPITDSLPSLQLCAMAIDSRSPDVLYLGTGDIQSPRPFQSVARSSDGGRTWALQARFTNQPVCALAVDPTNSARVLAGSGEGLFLSQDSGTTWSKVLSTGVTSIAFDSQGVAYAGTLGDRDHAVSRSSDNGRTWTDLPLSDNTTPSGVQTTWVNVTATATAVSVIVSYQAAAQSSSSSLSLMDFYRSTDSGNTWSTPLRIGDAHPPVQLISDTISGNLYVVGNSVFSSTDQGSSWSKLAATNADFHTAAFSGGILLLGGEKGLDSVSLVQGTAPRSISQPPLAQFLGINLDSRNGIWAGGPSGLFGPINAITESKVSGIDSAGIVASGANSSNIFSAGNNQVYRSNDAGANFSSRAVIAEDELRAPFPPVLLDPVNSASAYVAGTRLYRTTNSGQSWTALPVVDSDTTHVVIALGMAPAQRTALYAATACLPEVVLTACPSSSTIWRSANSGQTWSSMGSVSGYVNRLAVDPRQANVLYAAVGAFPGGPSLSAGLLQGDLQQSTNGGTTWISIRGNLPNVPINAVVIDPTSLAPVTRTFPGPGQFPTPGQPFGPTIFNQPAQTLYVATDAGVFVTFDLGGGGNVSPTPHWIDISWGLPPSPITDISLRQPGGILVAATFGRGAWSISTTGLATEVVANPLSIDVTLMKGTTSTAGVPLFNLSPTTTYGWRLNAVDSWITTLLANGTLRPRSSAQAAIRISAAALQTGTYVGRLQLVSGNFIQNVFVTTHVTAAPAQISVVGGNNATAGTGTTVPLQVLISDGNQSPLQGVPVSFAVTTGGGSISARTAFTNDAGIASAVLTLPANPGSVQIRATSGDLAVTFTVTAVNSPVLLADAVMDGVTFNAYTSLAPGSIVSITGQSLSQATIAAGTPVLPTMIEATRVLLNTPNSATTGIVPLPLLSVSPAQVQALLPVDLAPGVYGISVETASVPSNEIQISVAAFAPGILTQNSSGRGLGIFIKENGSVVSASNPADRGTRITFFASGLGAVNPPVAAGAPGAVAEPFNRTVATPRVFFDIYPADVFFSGLAPGSAGRYQVSIIVPTLVTPATNVSVSLTIGGFASNRVTIPVR